MSSNIVKLAPVERRLLRELDANSRRSFVELGKRLGSPAETVRYRFNKLVSSGAISELLTVIHTGKVGNDYYKVLVKLHNVNEKTVQCIIDELVADPEVNWVARMDGVFDISFTIRVKQIGQLSLFLDNFKLRHREHIHRLSFAVNVEVDYLVRDYLTGAKNKRKKRLFYSTPEGEIEVDELDRKILSHLANNSRIPSADIADLIGTTTETVRRRINRMERDGVIVCYRVVLNNSLLMQDNYYIFIYLNNVSADRLSKFRQFCRNHPNIVYLIKALGEWDYELNVEVENLTEYRNLMMSLTSEFSDIIRDYIGLPVSQVYKFTLSP